MTTEEAIKVLSKLRIPKDCEVHEAINKAIESMGKEQIVNAYFYDDTKYFECKSCGCVYGYYSESDNDLLSSKYCPSCGERLVW